MAFPSVVGSTQGASAATNTTTHSPTIPSGSVGDLILVMLSTSTTATITLPAGYELLSDVGLNFTSQYGHHFIWKIASATSETLTITTSLACQSTWFVYRFSNAQFAFMGGKSWSGTATTTPLTNTARGADYSKDTYYIAVLTTPSTVVATGAPTGFSGLLTQAAAGTGGSSTSIAIQQTTSNYVAGSNFTTGTATAYLTGMIAIEPTPPTGRPYPGGYFADYATINPPNANITYDFYRNGYGATQNAKANDIIIICASTGSIGQVQRAPNIATPGYTLLSTIYQPGANFSLTSRIFYKVATGAESNVVWNANGATNETGTIVGLILRPPNGSQTFTIRTPNSQSSNSIALPDPPAVTPNVASDNILIFGTQVANGGGVQSFTFPSFTGYWFNGYSVWNQQTAGTATGCTLEHTRWNGNSSIVDFAQWTAGGLANTTGGATTSISVVVSTSGGTFKVHNGDGTYTPHQTKYYAGSGTGWVTGAVLTWNGTTWIRSNTN